MMDLFRAHEADPTSEIHILYQKCKCTSRVVKAHEKILPPAAPQLNDYIPVRDIVDRLVHSYLETVEPIYRVLHVPSFLQEYERYWFASSSTNKTFVTKLLLAMAIATVFQPQNEAAVLRSSALQWIYTAQTWLSTPFDKYRLTVEGLQIQCLLLIARLVHDVDGDLLWLSAGYLVRTAMQMGLHIDADLYTLRKLSPQDIQLRRKLWATVLEISVQTSMDSGGVPLISENDYDCKPPLNMDDQPQKIDAETLLACVQPQTVFTQSSLQIMLTNSLPLRLEIAAYVNDFRRSSTTYGKTMQLSEKLLKVCNTNAALIQTFQTSSSHPSDFHVNMVELVIRQFLFALHYPYALQAKSDHTFYYSRKICLDTSLLFLSSFSQTKNDSCINVRLWGGGIFRALPQQFTCYVADELFYQIESGATSAIMTTPSSDRRSELRKYIQEYATFTLARVKNGHPNVRSHVMCSALLAHVDAVLAGSRVEENILATLKNSLMVCDKILQAQLEESPQQSYRFECDAQGQVGVDATGAGRVQKDNTVREIIVSDSTSN
jgi:hypothetical protein